MSLQRLLRTIGVLALVGLGISLYLTWVYTTDRVAICLGSGGCETVQYSPYAWILGIPIPTLGAGAYLMVLALAVWGCAARSRPSGWCWRCLARRWWGFCSRRT
ncbi:vitamin K epoxide reductase family protein [Symbiobacterium thermophilum]